MRMLFDRRTPSVPLRRALVEGLYSVFRAIIPPIKYVLPGGVDTTDNGIFEQSAICWMVLLDKSKDSSSEVPFACVTVTKTAPYRQHSS